MLSGYELQTFAIPKAYTQFRDTRSISNALGFDFDLSDTLAFSGEISLVSSKSKEPDAHFNLRGVNQANWDSWVATLTPDDLDRSVRNGIYDKNRDPIANGGAGLRNWYSQSFALNGSGVPTIATTDGSNPWTNPANLALRQYEYQDRRTDNDELALRFDVDWAEAFDLSYVSALKAGVRFTENDFDLTESEFDTGSNLFKQTFDNATGLSRYRVCR